MPRHVYVYYRVAHDEALQCFAAASRLQDALRTCCSHAALQRRPLPSESDAGEQTWMEVYRDVQPGFDSALAHAVKAQHLAHLARRTEVFVDLDGV